MQQEQKQKQQSPYWRDNHKHSRPTHSQWFQSNLSDLDSKIKMIMEVIENDGDTFAKRAEMYYEKRPELIKMVEEVHKTCRALADHNLKSAEFSASSRALSITQPPVEDARIFRAESIEEYLASGSESGSTGFDFQDFVSVESSNKLVIEAREKKMWEDQLKISKELEDNLSELVRRNEEKRERIIELQNENKFLKSCSNATIRSFRKFKENRCSTTDHNRISTVMETKPRKGKFSLFCMP